MFGEISVDFIPSLINPNNQMYSIEGFKRRDVDALYLRNSFSYLGLLTGLTLAYFFIKGLQKFFRSLQMENIVFRFFNTLIDKLVKTFEFTVFIGIIETAVMNITVFSLL